MLRTIDTRHLRRDLFGGQYETSVGGIDCRPENNAEHPTVQIDERSPGLALPHGASDRVHLARHRRGAVDVGSSEFDDLADPRRSGGEWPATRVAHDHG